MKRIIVLGSGMVGSAMAIDMASRHRVTLTDIDQRALKKAKQNCTSLETQQLNVTDKNLLQKAIQPYDLVICAVPGFLGFDTVKTIIEAGKNLVDISFFPENSLDLDGLAKRKKVTAIVDCGVAPGMHNLIVGHYNEKMRISSTECLVGGLPKERKWPFSYKAPFSPVDVIEEYIRPARFVENGKVVIKEALTDCESVEFEKIGTLEAFNSDGLRTMIDTLPDIPNMIEKTLRYPGHVEYIKVLKEGGFFSKEPIDLNGNKIIPLDFTSKVLFRDWKLGETEKEITVMRIIIKGKTSKEEFHEIEYNLYDEYSVETQTSSMARTTGYTATAAANMFLDGLFKVKGVIPPELIGKDDACFKYIMNYLEERNIHYKKTCC